MACSYSFLFCLFVPGILHSQGLASDVNLLRFLDLSADSYTLVHRINSILIIWNCFNPAAPQVLCQNSLHVPSVDTAHATRAHVTPDESLHVPDPLDLRFFHG